MWIWAPAAVFERNRHPERGDCVFGGGSSAGCEAACEYLPRRPEESVLYGAVAGHLETFLARQRERGRLVPRFVERELSALLDCAILARGFLRVHCDVCRLDRVVPYSCNCRGFCPSCCGRRMVKFTWYDGGLMPPRPEGLEEGDQLGAGGNGILFVGDKGMLTCPGWGGAPRLLPGSKHAAYKPPAETLPRSKRHHRDWLDACKGGKPASANFENGAVLSEIGLLGLVAMRLGKKMYWDAKNMQARNMPEANQYLKESYRPGWEVIRRTEKSTKSRGEARTADASLESQRAALPCC